MNNNPQLKKTEHEKTLGLFDLAILGIGAIIGTGILVLTGIVAAEDSGPAIVFSFLIAATISLFLRYFDIRHLKIHFRRIIFTVRFFMISCFKSFLLSLIEFHSFLHILLTELIFCD